MEVKPRVRRRSFRRLVAALAAAVTVVVAATLGWSGVRLADMASWALLWLLLSTAVAAGTVAGAWVCARITVHDGTGEES